MFDFCDYIPAPFLEDSRDICVNTHASRQEIRNAATREMVYDKASITFFPAMNIEWMKRFWKGLNFSPKSNINRRLIYLTRQFSPPVQWISAGFSEKTWSKNDPPIPCNSGGHLIRRLYFSGILQATQPTAMEMLRDWRERAFSLWKNFFMICLLCSNVVRAQITTFLMMR